MNVVDDDSDRQATIDAMLAIRVGQTIEIEGLGACERTDTTYVYSLHGVHCPACDRVSIPWGGWFRCEWCPLVAFIPTGQCFHVLDDFRKAAP